MKSNTSKDNKKFLMSEWKEYVQALTCKYGKVTNLIWISKKRRKFILEFAYARILVINDNLYKFSDITSCKIEQVSNIENEQDSNTVSLVLQIGTNHKTERLISMTISSTHTVQIINNLFQEIIKSNKLFHE